MKYFGTMSDPNDLVTKEYVDNNNYAICPTIGSNASKAINISNFSLTTGINIRVKFTHADTSGTPTLNVSNTGAVAIKSYGTSEPINGAWKDNEVVSLVYDGTYWMVQGVTNAIIDDTLTIQGAAADAKATGDEIGDLNSALNSIEYAGGCPWIKELYINSDGRTYGTARVGTLQSSEIDGVPVTRLRFTSSDGQTFKGNSEWFPTANPPFNPIKITYGSNPGTLIGYVLADFTDPTISIPFNAPINEPAYHLDMSPTIKMMLEYGVLDTTLSQAGYAADAKATGDALDEVMGFIGEIGLPYKEIVDSSSDFTESDVVLHGGATRSFSGWAATDYISVIPGQQYEYAASSFNKTVSGTLYVIDAVSFFNENKTYIDGIYSSETTSGETLNGTFTVPDGTFYVKMSLYPAVTTNPKLNRLASGWIDNAVHAKVVFVGDSLTQGVTGGTVPNLTFAEKPFPTIFKEELLKRGFDITMKNFGRRGLSAITYWEKAIPANGQYHSPAAGEPGDTLAFDSTIDCVFIMLGTNGHLDTNTIAEDTAIQEGQTYEDYADTNCGDYCKIIEYIMEQTENHAQIILISPVYACANSYKNKIINTLPTIKALGERYQIPVINGVFESGIGAFNSESFYNQDDLVHLNQAGYHKFGTFIASQFVSLYSTFNMDEIPVVT